MVTEHRLKCELPSTGHTIPLCQHRGSISDVVNGVPHLVRREEPESQSSVRKQSGRHEEVAVQMRVRAGVHANGFESSQKAPPRMQRSNSSQTVGPPWPEQTAVIRRQQ